MKSVATILAATATCVNDVIVRIYAIEKAQTAARKCDDVDSHRQISSISIWIKKEIPTVVKTYYSRSFIMRTFAIYVISITFIVGLIGC